MVVAAKPVLISAGHGGPDPGAVSPDSQYQEAKLAVRLRDAVAELVRAEGVKVVEDGADGVNDPLKSALPLIKLAKGPRLELHWNAGPSAATGVEALSLPAYRALSQKLASAVANVLRIPLRGDRGYKPQDSGQHHRLAWCMAGGVILEVCFISNKQDMAAYIASEAQVAKVIAQVLVGEVKG